MAVLQYDTRHDLVADILIGVYDLECQSYVQRLLDKVFRLTTDVEQLERVIRWYFSVDRSNEGTDLDIIGACMDIMPADIRATILRICEAAEAAGKEGE